MKLQNRKLLIATRNEGKFFEISKFLSDLPIKILSLKDLGIKIDFEEAELTYEKNSQKKALFFSKLTKLPTIADDGGIEIEALGGKPGIHSRRWFGKSKSDKQIINKMKKIAKKLPKGKRKAYFKTVVSLAFPSGKVISAKGEVEGEIREPYLTYLKGYPYRSFFYLPKIKKFYHESELTQKEERMYNHRYKAIQKLKPVILKYA
ncbi:MAG: hypothetical protein A2W22_06615 [Candidatus Levybacteria bacterium RBG_16_35_11]|nr:MAG: hypothetical protein A2W22_06615 [Candidatus Levybacteria bacterium RBG_16_35_11]